MLKGSPSRRDFPKKPPMIAIERGIIIIWDHFVQEDNIESFATEKSVPR
jgi:hypothetical protein